MRFKSESRAIHGGRGEYLKIADQNFLDLSANLNPYPPKLDLSISFDAVMKYPDDDYFQIKETISRFHHCSPDNITVGNGSAEILRTFCHTVLYSGSLAFVPPHTFSEYGLSARLAGADLSRTEEKSNVSFLCNPDNPSGRLLSRENVLEKIPDIKENRILCVDEAFIDLADPGQSVSDILNPNLFILRSLTKSYAIPGVRFGYGIGDPELIKAMEVMRPPWTVNVLAESLVIQAFSLFNELSYSRDMIRSERKRVYYSVIAHGWECNEGCANYLLINTGLDSRKVAEKFLEENILVRDCASFGLPHHIRIAIRTVKENDQFIEALRRF